MYVIYKMNDIIDDMYLKYINNGINKGKEHIYDKYGRCILSNIKKIYCYPIFKKNKLHLVDAAKKYVKDLGGDFIMTFDHRKGWNRLLKKLGFVEHGKTLIWRL